MTSLLSAISGKFSVPVVLGTVFPVTIFVIAARLLLSPLFPNAIDLPFLEDSEVFTLSLLILVLSGLFHHLSTPHIRLYEGYPWRNTAIGKLATKRLAKKLDGLVTRRDGYSFLSKAYRKQSQHLLAALKKQGKSSSPELTFTREAEAASKIERDRVRGELNNNFPVSSGSVLPTRLGNTIRSFENYPARMYGMAAVPLWPRLMAKIEPRYAQTITDAKASFDFMLHSATLSGGLALLLLASGSLKPKVVIADGSWQLWLVEIFSLALLSVWSYRQSIGRAGAWGGTVRSAFDLYRRDLLSQLGYTQTPATEAEEKALWAEISWRIDYAYEAKVPFEPAPMTAASTEVDAEGETALHVLRAVEPASTERLLEVVIEIRNPNQDPAVKVSVSDMVPSGYDLVAGSVRADLGAATVTGINPYRFEFDTAVDPKATRQLRYTIQRRPKST